MKKYNTLDEFMESLHWSYDFNDESDSFDLLDDGGKMFAWLDLHYDILFCLEKEIRKACFQKLTNKYIKNKFIEYFDLEFVRLRREHLYPL